MSGNSPLGKRDPNSQLQVKTQKPDDELVDYPADKVQALSSPHNSDKGDLAVSSVTMRPRLPSEPKPWGGIPENRGAKGSGEVTAPQGSNEKAQIRKGSFEPHVAAENSNHQAQLGPRGNNGGFYQPSMFTGPQMSPGGSVVKGLTIPVPPGVALNSNPPTMGPPLRIGVPRGSGMIKIPGSIFDPTKDYVSEYHLVYLANLTLIDKIEQMNQENRNIEKKIMQIKSERALAAAGQSNPGGRKRSTGGASDSALGGGDSSCGEDSNSMDEQANPNGTAKRRKKRRKKEEIVREFVCPIKDCGRSYGTENSLNQHMKIKHVDTWDSIREGAKVTP